MKELRKIEQFELLRMLLKLKQRSGQMQKDFKQSFEIMKHFATLYEKGGYTKEFNLIKYEKTTEPKFDIRLFKNLDNKKIMLAKGITFTQAEIKQLKNILNNMEI